MVNQNQHRLERSGCPEQTPTPCDAVGNIARQAYTDTAIVATTCNTSGDALPNCNFGPLTPKEQREAYVREIAAPLFEGSPPLIAYLDRSSYKGTNREFDGRVSAHNMRDFLKTYETESAMGRNEWPYTEKNAQYVRDLLDFKYPEITGENFAGFSTKALCRRAGLTKVRVKDYEGYAVLAESWKQATQEDSTFRQDVQASHERNDAAEAAKRIANPCDTPKVQDPCDVPPPAPPAKDPCEVVPPPKAQDPCDVPPVTKPCDVPQPCGMSEAEKAARFQADLDRMSTFERGSTYWGISKKLLHAGMQPGDRDDITNRDIHRLTRSLLEISYAHTNDKGIPNPMPHPRDRVHVREHIDELAVKHEKLARALDRLLVSEQQE